DPRAGTAGTPGHEERTDDLSITGAGKPGLAGQSAAPARPIWRSVAPTRRNPGARAAARVPVPEHAAPGEPAPGERATDHAGLPAGWAARPGATRWRVPATGWWLPAGWLPTGRRLPARAVGRPP